MPDVLTLAVSRVRRRWRVRLLALALAIGGAVFALTLLLAPALFETSRTTALWIAALAAIDAAAWFALANRQFSALDAAKAIERSTGPHHNLVVTAVELDEQPRPVSAEMRAEIARQAAARLQSLDVASVVPLLQPIAIATAVLAGCAVLAGIDSDATTSPVERARYSVETRGSGPFNVRVVPPSYTGRNVEEFANPSQITVIAGSRVRIEGKARGTVRDWIATASEGLLIGPDPLDPLVQPQFLSVIVVPDLPPSLRIAAPGKDTAFATPAGQLAISIESNDDLGLASLALRFTKASGGGENLSFTEGEAPITLERRSHQHWIGRTSLALDTLGLIDGDIVVYRAVARDTNPNGAPVQSDQYLIEIGRNAQLADAGFSLPNEEKKYAISQQMVIYKTEQLLKGAGGTGAGGELEQSRLIAVEQRMVRAEVVFLAGGEVEDEVEEAAHAHELAEGRMQNTGRAEMQRALNAMSRAEALLNDGRAREALVFEREALASLERALDRRRYFLRTLPDRSRIDATRRLTGPRTEARSWLRDQSSGTPGDAIAAHRRLMQELLSAAAGGAAIDASLAARIAAIDPSAPDLQKAAVAIASASSGAARQQAVRAAMQAVTAHALKTLPAATAIDARSDALAGQLADQLRAADPRSRQ